MSIADKKVTKGLPGSKGMKGTAGLPGYDGDHGRKGEACDPGSADHSADQVYGSTVHKQLRIKMTQCLHSNFSARC